MQNLTTTKSTAANGQNVANEMPAIGARVKMVSENSNWNVGELGTVIGQFGDRAAVDFDGRRDGDGYAAFLDAFEII